MPNSSIIALPVSPQIQTAIFFSSFADVILSDRKLSLMLVRVLANCRLPARSSCSTNIRITEHSKGSFRADGWVARSVAVADLGQALMNSFVAVTYLYRISMKSNTNARGPSPTVQAWLVKSYRYRGSQFVRPLNLSCGYTAPVKSIGSIAVRRTGEGGIGPCV